MCHNHLPAKFINGMKKERWCAMEGHINFKDKEAPHITPEAVPLSIKSANAETGVGVTSRP